MRGIFISYRREDSADVTGRIADRLRERYGEDAVFTDVDSVPIGVDFRRHVDGEMGHCDVFLAIVGRRWASMQDDEGNRRLDDPSDFVRIEIESALNREILVVPLLVHGISMPSVDDLPVSMRDFAFRNGVLVRPDPDFHNDMDRVIEGIEEHFGLEKERVDTVDNVGKVRRTENDGQQKDQLVARERGRGRDSEVVEQNQNTASTEATHLSGQTGKNKWPNYRYSMLLAGVGLLAVVAAGWYYFDSTKQDAVSVGAKLLSVFQDELSVGVPGPKMVVIQPGSFLMGSPDSEVGREHYEGPQHKVTLKAFAIGQYEVTVGDFGLFTEQTGYKTDAESQSNEGCYLWDEKKSRAVPQRDKNWRAPEFTQSDRHPVSCISWRDTQAYIAWLNQQTGKAYRLPSEAEWEYVARAGSSKVFGAVACLSTEQVNYDGSVDYDNCGANTGRARGQTMAVELLPANAWGLHHIYGNLWEWTQDCWHGDYQGAPDDGAAWTEENNGNCDRRVQRGGSWDDYAQHVRAAERDWDDVDVGDYSVGFRLARDL